MSVQANAVPPAGPSGITVQIVDADFNPPQSYTLINDVYLENQDGSIFFQVPFGTYSADTSFAYTINNLTNPGFSIGETVYIRGYRFTDEFQLISEATFVFELPCLRGDTKVLMADGTEKEIRDIIRGDLVRGDLTDDSIVYKVSRVNVLPYTAGSTCDLVVIAPGALGENMPNQTLHITGWHPILYKGARRPAKCFRNVDGVTFHENALASTVMDLDGERFVYDLQFEFDGQYVAQNTLVMSRSPWYEGSPLPKDMYFDQSLYREERTGDTLNHPVAYDNTVL